MARAFHQQPCPAWVTAPDHRGRIDRSIDTGQQLSEADLHHRVQATLYHEVHHALRWDGPGHWRTLGEALVCEGLARHFVDEAFKPFLHLDGA